MLQYAKNTRMSLQLDATINCVMPLEACQKITKKILTRRYILMSHKYKLLPVIYFQAVYERTWQTLCSHHFAGSGSTPCVLLKSEVEKNILHPCAPEKNPSWLAYKLTYCSKNINPHNMRFYFSCIDVSQLSDIHLELFIHKD